MGAPTEAIAKLQQYTACDVSDALLKLKVPGSGFVADLNLYSQPKHKPTEVTVAPVSTVLFVAKGELLTEPAANIPKGVHWADLTQSGTIVVLKQPEGQKNAICGGIMAVRMKVCEAKGIVVAGRARDIEELKGTDLPVSFESRCHMPFESKTCRSGPVDSQLSALVAAVPLGRRRYLWTLMGPSSLLAT